MFKALFWPAIAAMNRMNFFVKFVFIGLLLLLPFAYVTHLMKRESDRQIVFNQKERYGVAYITQASRLLSHLQACRIYSAAVLCGDASWAASLATRKNDIDVLLPVLDRTDALYKEEFRTAGGTDACSRRWTEIRAAWTALRGREFTTPVDSFTAHTQICSLVTDWILNDVANYSNLILDPDLDSYWLMDAYVGKLPQISEDLSQAGARSLRYLQDLRSPGADVDALEDERLDLHGIYADASASIDGLLNVNLKTAYGFSAANGRALQSKIDPAVREATALSREFLDEVKGKVVRPNRVRATTKDIVERSSRALAALHALTESVGPELDALILARVKSYEGDRTLGIIAAESATFLHVYLFIAFYLAIHASVAQVSRFTRRMIEGTTEHFKLDSHDELGHVAESFNEINTALNQTRALKDQVERRGEELKASEERFRTVAANAPVGIYQTDALGNCTYVNGHWSHLALLSSEEAMGHGWVKALHPDDRERIAREWTEATRAGRDFASEYRFAAPGAAPVWLAGNAVAMRNREGAITGFLGSITDITDRKKLDQLKNEFISTVSHELRTPLTSIRGALGLVNSGVVGALPPKAKPMIEIASKNCERLVNLVSDILDIEKIASGQMVFKIRALSLKTVAAQTIEANRGFGDGLGVALKLECEGEDPIVRADSDRLIQVMTNLISNACKFSPRGGAVTVGIGRRDGQARLYVQDRGPGMPDEFKSRIFQKFAQADASDGSQRKGTGLGLAISKGLIEKMGGTIGFDSTLGVGTTFWFQLPEERIVLPAPAPAAGPGRARILVCEDEPDIAQILRVQLDREGYDSDVAPTLKAARELLAKVTYVGLTLDLSLPDGNGVRLLNEIRQNPATAQLPVIVISANLEQNTQALSGQAFGLVDWIEKPIPEGRLEEALRRSCSGATGKRPRVLHVEDDADIRKIVAGVLQDVAEVVQTDTVMSGWEHLKTEDYDLLIVDVGLPDGTGLELLPALNRTTNLPIPAIVFSAHEVSPRTGTYVSAALLKSRTTNDELVARVKALLGRPVPAAPKR